MVEEIRAAAEERHVPKNDWKSRVMLMSAGTGSVVLVSLILFQFFATDDRPVGRNLSAGVKSDSAGTAHVGQAATGRRPVAQVTNGTSKAVIYEDDLARECIQRVGKDVLDNLINRTVIQLACNERGIAISTQEVEQEISRIAKEFNLDPKGWLEFLQKEREITPAQYRRDIIWPMLALRKLAGEQVTITEADLQRAFQRHYGPRVRARMILCDNIRRANTIWQEAVSHPEDFERLAREHSVDPNSRALDGKIPPIAHFSSSEELEKAAFKLREGEISGIIHIGLNRYVILKCEGYTDQLVKDIEEVRPLLYQELEKQKVQEMIAKFFEKLKQETRVDNYLANTSTGGVRQTASQLSRNGQTNR